MHDRTRALRPIDADKLLRFPIPSVKQRVTPRDAAFYALSTGMGGEQLPFVDPLAGPRAHPAMALVLAHPGFWLGHPNSGVDPVAVLHGAQAFELFAPIPVDGDVESKTRITHLVDKGPGKPALIFTSTDLTDSSGTRFAQLDRTTFIRGGGGFGGTDSAPVKPTRPIADGPADQIIDLPTTIDQALFYRLNGDLNPLHSDPAIAAEAGFARPILHGLCTMGVIVHALLRGQLDYQSARFRSVSLRFASPVLPGETIRTEIWNNGAFLARAVERDIVVADQGYFTEQADRSNV